MGATLGIWCLAMLGPGTTVVHQGTYPTELLAIGGGTLILWAFSHRLAVVLVTLQVVFNLVLYFVIGPPVSAFGNYGPPDHADWAVAGIAAALLLATLLASGRTYRPQHRSSSFTQPAVAART